MFPVNENKPLTGLSSLEIFLAPKPNASENLEKKKKVLVIYSITLR